MRNLIKKILKEEFQEEKLWEVKFDMFEGDYDFERYRNMLEVYHKIKDKKGFTGIKIHGDLDLQQGLGNIENLDDLVEITGNLNLNYTILTSLPNLKKVGGRFVAADSEIVSLNDLEYIGRDLILKESQIKSLPKLKYVYNELDLSYTKISSLPSLEKVGGHLDLDGSEIENLNKLEFVGRDCFLSKTKIADLPSLKSVGGNLWLTDTPLIRKFKVGDLRLLRTKIDIKGKILY